MPVLYNEKLKSNSQKLRKNMTREERKMWFDFLKKLPVNIYRQKIFGNYIVDFCCTEFKVIIEIDGSQHYTEEVNGKFKDVCEDILRYIKIY